MRQLSSNLLLALALLLPPSVQAGFDEITRIYRQVPSIDTFDICTGGGCAEVKHIALSADEWEQVVDVFAVEDDAEMDAKQERQLIAAAIGELEKIVGAKTGTASDRAGTFDNSHYPGQLDCNDEAINSTTYMRLMRDNGLIQLHEIEDMRTRSFFFNGWPHSTAVIREVATGDRFAVDSWFYDNGFPATVIPFAIWKSGYTPIDSPLTLRIGSVKP